MGHLSAEMRIPEGTLIYGEADASIVLVQMVDSHDLEESSPKSRKFRDGYPEKDP